MTDPNDIIGELLVKVEDLTTKLQQREDQMCDLKMVLFHCLEEKGKVIITDADIARIPTDCQIKTFIDDLGCLHYYTGDLVVE